jgi:hypothetical protein
MHPSDRKRCMRMRPPHDLVFGVGLVNSGRVPRLAGWLSSGRFGFGYRNITDVLVCGKALLAISCQEGLRTSMSGEMHGALSARTGVGRKLCHRIIRVCADGIYRSVAMKVGRLLHGCSFAGSAADRSRGRHSGIWMCAGSDDTLSAGEAAISYSFIDVARPWGHREGHHPNSSMTSRNDTAPSWSRRTVRQVNALFHPHIHTFSARAGCSPDSACAGSANLRPSCVPLTGG